MRAVMQVLQENVDSGGGRSGGGYSGEVAGMLPVL
jgi:hypothetical protein